MCKVTKIQQFNPSFEGIIFNWTGLWELLFGGRDILCDIRKRMGERDRNAKE